MLGLLGAWQAAAVAHADPQGQSQAGAAQPAPEPAAKPATPAPAAGSADVEDRPLELSFIVGGHFFSDSSALGRSDYAAPNSSLAHSVAIGGRAGYGLSKYFLLEAEFLAMPTKMAAIDGQVFAYTGRGHLAFRFPFGPGRRFEPFVLLGGGAIAARPDPGLQLKTETLGAFHTGLGLRVNVHRWVGLRVDGRMVLVPEVRTPTFTQDYEVLGSAYVRFGFTPDKPVETKPADVDNDGVPDAEDRCPAEAGLKDNAGCPDKDADGDTVVDRLDKCPDRAGLAENAGCPDTDTDGDGIVDRLDKCPNEVGPKGNKGCPDTDADGDGVVDRLDKCPNEPETRNNYKDNDGCPDELPPNLAKFVGTIQGLKFLPNKAILTKESLVILDEAVTVLTEHNKVKVEIGGHTDNIGVAAENLALSQQRADAVKNYLASKGIDPNRLTAIGYGQTQPVADNGNAAGRAQNRRVEFKLLPTGRAATQPAAPGAAAVPGKPTTPVAPVAPAAPTAPMAPAAPAAPPAWQAPAAPAVPAPPAPPAWQAPSAPAVPQPPAAPPAWQAPSAPPAWQAPSAPPAWQAPAAPAAPPAPPAPPSWQAPPAPSAPPAAPPSPPTWQAPPMPAQPVPPPVPEAPPAPPAWPAPPAEAQPAPAPQPPA
ncbi:MAG TPA: OmpA family protein [Pseudomonadota bacterium]|nr:OmpA family protein [Pseudomonadota bacterium]